MVVYRLGNVSSAWDEVDEKKKPDVNETELQKVSDPRIWIRGKNLKWGNIVGKIEEN